VRAVVERVRPDAVFHLAARRDGGLPELLEHNAVATDVLLSALRAHDPSVPVVVVGSAAEIGHVEPDENPLGEDARCRPLDAYGISKLAQAAVAQAAFLQHGQPVVRVRLFNLLGPRLPATLLPGRCVELLAVHTADQPLRFRDLSARRDYLDVRDAVNGLVRALERGTPGTLYHLGSGQAHSGREVVEALIAAAHEAGSFRYEESLPSPPTASLQVSDPRRAGRELEWAPAIPFDRSIREMWQDRAQ
jgi:GDP-4-dehydro-6-deoxy-D-mannose reductase